MSFSARCSGWQEIRWHIQKPSAPRRRDTCGVVIYDGPFAVAVAPYSRTFLFVYNLRAGGKKKPPLTARNLRRIKVTLDPQPGAKYNWDGLISSPEIGGEEADPSAEFNFRGRGPPFDVVCSKNFSELII